MDTMTPEQRRQTMSHIRSKDTSIEVALRKALWHAGLRYRKNYRALPGSPDIALTRYKIAVFCDSEFFHGYQWDRKKRRLGENRGYWIKKIERNMGRDAENDRKLCCLGWIPVHFWGQDIMKDTAGCVGAIEDLIFELKLDALNEPPIGTLISKWDCLSDDSAAEE